MSWFTKYIFIEIDSSSLNNIIIMKTKVLLSPTYVPLTDVGYRV